MRAVRGVLTLLLRYHVTMGYSEDRVHVHRFYPNEIRLHPGDVVNFYLLPMMVAPHIATFPNGAPVQPPQLALAGVPGLGAPWNLYPPTFPIIATNNAFFFPTNPAAINGTQNPLGTGG